MKSLSNLTANTKFYYVIESFDASHNAANQPRQNLRLAHNRK
jgi:hypothetical protein